MAPLPTWLCDGARVWHCRAERIVAHVDELGLVLMIPRRGRPVRYRVTPDEVELALKSHELRPFGRTPRPVSIAPAP